MPDTPLNPDALEAAADAVVDASFGQELPEAPIDLATAAVSAYLTVAQPVVNTFEESDALPVGSVVLDVDGNTARRFPGGWRTTVVEADGSVWLSGNMEDPDLPARVLYRPVVKP